LSKRNICGSVQVLEGKEYDVHSFFFKGSRKEKKKHKANRANYSLVNLSKGSYKT
jgi:hypothetical protein